MRRPAQFFYCTFFSILLFSTFACQDKTEASNASEPEKLASEKKVDSSVLDSIDYEKRMQAIINNDTSGRWNFKTPHPLPGAILPYKRVIAFYGNLFSKRMGVLGALPKNQMISLLKEETAKWRAADSVVPPIPALHYIAITAQGKPGKQNKYRQRMPHRHIDTILSWAKEIDGIVFLDVQIGQSTVIDEVNTLVNYLKLPNVHLGLDPEFSMKDGRVPGTKIGTMSADEINGAIDILQKLVKEHNLPPKILVIHRFTRKMVTDYQKIKTCPEVQIVMHMDGFGSKALKRSTYQMAIYKEPVQFTGFKLFYKNDTKGNNAMYTPEEILRFKPMPVYIQYQ